MICYRVLGGHSEMRWCVEYGGYPVGIFTTGVGCLRIPFYSSLLGSCLSREMVCSEAKLIVPVPAQSLLCRGGAEELTGKWIWFWGESGG
jgi:hypothetical protein